MAALYRGCRCSAADKLLRACRFSHTTFATFAKFDGAQWKLQHLTEDPCRMSGVWVQKAGF